MPKIEDYKSIVGEDVVNELFLIAEKLDGKVIQNINSTSVGGGVAEILTRMIPLQKQLGIDARWDVIKGDDRFFAITKNIHNALHGVSIKVTDDDLNYFLEVDKQNAEEMNFSGDIVVIHDPQPIALVEKKGSISHKNGCGGAT